MQQTAAKIYAEHSLLSVEREIVPVKEVFRLQGDAELEAAEQRYLPAKEASDTVLELFTEQKVEQHA